MRRRLALLGALGTLAACAIGPTPPPPAGPPASRPAAPAPGPGVLAPAPVIEKPIQKTIRRLAVKCADGGALTLVFLDAPRQMRVERANAAPILLEPKSARSGFRYGGHGFEAIGRADGGVDWSAPGRLVTACKAR